MDFTAAKKNITAAENQTSIWKYVRSLETDKNTFKKNLKIQ